MSKENIGDVIAKTLEGEPPATVSAPRTLDQIAADIVRKDQQVGLGLISIGNDLIEAKERVEHGKWREWLDLNVGYSERKAQMCMQVARRYGSNPQLVADLGIRKVTALMLLPSGEDAEFLETHDVPNMSTRELEQAIRERDEAKAAAEAAAIHAGQLQRELDDERQTVDRLLDSSTKYEETNATLVEDNKELAYKLRQTAERVKELESAPKEVYKDEEAIQKAADEARDAADAEWSAKVNDLAIELAEARKNAEIRRTNAQDEHRCITGLNPHGSCGAASYCTKPYSCCIACPSPCNSYCGFLPETQSEALPNVAPVVSPCWYVGIPPKDGLYYAEFECAGTPLRTPARWGSVMRYWTFNHGAKIDAECRRWWPLPEDE